MEQIKPIAIAIATTVVGVLLALKVKEMLDKAKTDAPVKVG